jgi:hypothetical protein
MELFKNSENARRWFRFAADDLAALLYPNICGTLSDSCDAFSYVKNVDSFTTLQKVSIQYLGALAMYFAASKVKCECMPLPTCVSIEFLRIFKLTEDECSFRLFHSKTKHHKRKSRTSICLGHI